MLVIVFILCLLLMYIGYSVTRSVFSPMVLISGVWGIVIGLFFVLGDILFPVMNIFPLAILLWIVCFYGAAFYTEIKSVPFRLAAEREGKPNASILKIYYIVVCLSIPLILLLVLLDALKGPADNLLFNLRMLNIEGFKIGILGYLISLAFVAYLIELANYSAQNKKRVYILLCFNLLIATITVSKLVFLSILFSSIIILYYKKRIKIKKIFFLFLGFLLFSVLLQSLRTGSGDNITFKNFITIYILSGSVAFDHFADAFKSSDIGENTFRFLYAVAHALGADVKVNSPLLEFVEVPLPTNVYTVLYIFYTDFSWLGIIIFALVLGCFYGFIHRQIRNGESFFLVVYAIFATFIIMQFMGELIFVNLSLTIQYLFYAILPFIIKKEIKITW